MQLKTTDHLRTTRDGSAVLVRLERRDVLTWIAEAYPVILVLYDAAQDGAFWLWIQTHFAVPDAFAKLHGKTVTVPIPVTNVLNERAMRAFARAKAAILPTQGVER